VAPMPSRTRWYGLLLGAAATMPRAVWTGAMSSELQRPTYSWKNIWMRLLALASSTTCA